MAIKVLIKRHFKAGKSAQGLALLTELRNQAMKQPGYISGETLKRVDHPGECVVISTWKSVDEWYKWLNNPDRLKIQSQIDMLLGAETTYEIYEAG